MEACHLDVVGYNGGYMHEMEYIYICYCVLHICMQYYGLPTSAVHLIYLTHKRQVTLIVSVGIPFLAPGKK